MTLSPPFVLSSSQERIAGHKGKVFMKYKAKSL